MDVRKMAAAESRHPIARSKHNFDSGWFGAVGLLVYPICSR